MQPRPRPPTPRRTFHPILNYQNVYPTDSILTPLLLFPQSIFPIFILSKVSSKMSTYYKTRPLPPLPTKPRGERAIKPTPTENNSPITKNNVHLHPRRDACRHANTIFDTDELFLPATSYSTIVPVNVSSPPPRVSSRNWTVVGSPSTPPPTSVLSTYVGCPTVNSTLATDLLVIEPGHHDEYNAHRVEQVHATSRVHRNDFPPRLSEYAFGGEDYFPGMGYGTGRSHGSRLMGYRTEFEEEEQEVRGSMDAVRGLVKKVWKKVKNGGK